MNTPLTFYVSNAIFEWEAMSESAEVLGTEWQVPYFYHARAERLLDHHDRHFLIDAISNLKRAVDHRIKQLTAIYRIKKTPAFRASQSVLEAMSMLEVIKPIMLKQLTDIRNTVEHHFADPPTPDRCRELAEFAWYFLRSTDTLSRQRATDFGISESFDGAYSVAYLGLPSNDWEQRVLVKLPAELASRTLIEHAFPVEVETLWTRDEYVAKEAERGSFLEELDMMVAARQAAGLQHRRLRGGPRRATCYDLRRQQQGDRPWKSVPSFTWAWTSTRTASALPQRSRAGRLDG